MSTDPGGRDTSQSATSLKPDQEPGMTLLTWSTGVRQWELGE